MAKDLKVGERVRVYGHFIDGLDWICTSWRGEKGTVQDFLGGVGARGITVSLDEPIGNKSTKLVRVHINQCRRLRKKKKLKAIWIHWKAVQTLADTGESYDGATILCSPPVAVVESNWVKFERTK